MSLAANSTWVRTIGKKWIGQNQLTRQNQGRVFNFRSDRKNAEQVGRSAAKLASLK
jgi:hypothetical protein